MKKVILVFAGKKDFYKPSVPLSLLALVPYIKEAGYDVEILDTRVDDVASANLDDVICIGFSTNTGLQIKYSLLAAKQLRQKLPNVPFIWGGAHPSILPEQTLKNKYVDIIIRGEGELTMPELVQTIDMNGDLAKVKGIIFKKEKNIVFNKPRPLMSMQKLKRPAYDLIDKNKYNTSIIYYFFSRGCPHRCRFCCNSIFGQGTTYRTKDVKIIIDDLKFIKRYFKPDFISLIDDNAFVDAAKFKTICKEIIKSKLNIRYTASCRFEYIAKSDHELMQLIKDSGCFALILGGESGSQDMLDYICKDTKLSEMVRAIEMCDKYDIEPRISFIIGFPKEKEKNRQRTWHFIDMLTGINKKTQVNGIFIFTPYPGTKLFDEAVTLNFKYPDTLEKWGDYNFSKMTKLPWLNIRQKSKLLTITMISRLPFIKHLHTEHKKLAFFAELVYQFYLHDAWFRWKHKFFSWGIEWWILYFMRRNYYI